MAFKINPLQNPEFELQRILSELAAEANSLLKDESIPVDDKMHDFRVTIKKIRATLKLMRYNLGKDVYKAENEFYRGLQHEFSLFRDSNVMRSTLESLLTDASETLNLRLFDPYYSDLNERYLQVKDEMSSGGLTGKVLKRLEGHIPEISSLELQDKSIQQAGAGLGKIYKQARKAMKKAIDESSAENMHEWRKKTKYLWYQVRMLELLWPEIMGGLDKSIHHLSDLLGSEHDLSILVNALNDKRYEGHTTVHSVKSFALAKKEDLGRQARQLGSKVFYESPGKFSRRIMHYWEETVGRDTAEK